MAFFAVPLAAMVLDGPRGFLDSPAALAAALVTLLMGVAVPLLAYQTARERFVTSQRPYEDDIRFYSLGYGGIAAGLASIAIYIPMW
jgi:hypothetical protein